MKQDSEHRATAGTAGDVGATLAWPPPALERLHGAVWPIIGMLGLGGLLMTAPMLLLLTARPPMEDGTIYAGAWWLSAGVSVLGLVLAIAGLIRGGVLLRAVGRAASHGYDGLTIGIVACDDARDAGSLLLGTQHYGSMGTHERSVLLRLRIIGALSYSGAVLWMPVAFAIGIVLSVRGVIGGLDSLWPLVLGPASLGIVIGLGCRGFDTFVTRRARAQYRKSEVGGGRVRRDVRDWIAARAEQRGDRVRDMRPNRAPKLTAVALYAVAGLLPLPVLLLALLSVAGPLLDQTLAPRTGSFMSHIARTVILRPYALPSDADISPAEAGAVLQVLNYVGRPGTQREPVERAPVRTYEQSWLGDNQPQSITSFARFVTELMDGARVPTADERAYLERIAAHPAQAEFTNLARAAQIDVAGGRLNTDALADMDMVSLPVPRFGGLRNAAWTHLARAFLEAERGDLQAAEMTIREVISVGLLLVENSTSMIEVLIGSALAQSGAYALRAFYEDAGRAADANALRLALDGVSAAETAARSLQGNGVPRRAAPTAMSIASNPDMPPGLRWESLWTAHLASGCSSANVALFGLGQDHEGWLEQTRASLVRFPSEAALFDVANRGVRLDDASRTTHAVQGLLRFTFGGSNSAGSCAGLATTIAMND